MPVAISSISPGRGRPGDSVTINGSGFSSSGANLVTVDGSQVPGAQVTTISETAIEFVIPGGIPEDQSISVSVSSLEDMSSADWFWWSKAPVSALPGYEFPIKVPGQQYDRLFGGTQYPGTTGPTLVDDEDFLQMQEKADQIQDQLSLPGSILARGVNGMRAFSGADGDRFMRTPTGMVVRSRNPEVHSYGYFSAIGSGTGEIRFSSGAKDTIATPVGVDRPVQSSGHIVMASVYVRLSEPADSVRLNRVRIYVNDVVAWDSAQSTETQAFVKTGEVWTVAPWIPVSAGDRIGLSANRAFSGLDNIHARGTIQVA